MSAPLDMTEFEGDFDGWFVNDQDPPVTKWALLLAALVVADGMLLLAAVGAARAVWRALPFAKELPL